MAATDSRFEVSPKTYPARCSLCEALQQAPLACTDCHDLLEQVQVANYFDLFGLTRTYALSDSDLNAKYLAISRNIHPDRFASNDEAMQRFALRTSAAINLAYATLRDPFRRAEYLLETSGGKSAAQDKSVPPTLLSEVMMLREELAEARATGDHPAIDSMSAVVDEKRREAEKAIAGLCASLVARADDPTRDELRKQLNSLKYYNNLASELSSAQAAAATP